MLLRPTFFRRDTLEVARDLIGAEVYHKKGQSVTSGIIVETEAYLGESDPASHAFIGRRNKNAPMFEAGGIVYVYFTYGNHHCMNFVTEAKDHGCAVLIRALEPKEGISLMKRRRRREKLKDLTTGPGKLTQALGIDLRNNRQELRKGQLWVEKTNKTARTILQTPRIGISKAKSKPYRFIDKDSLFLSKKFK